MIYSLFYHHNSSCTVFWVSSSHLSVNIVVLYQFTVPGHVYRELRILSSSVRSLGRKKGSRLRLCFWVVDDIPEKKGVDLWMQMLSRKCSFKCICILSQRAFYSQSAVCILHFTHSLHFTPGPQPAVRSLRFTLIDSLTFQQLITIIKTAMKWFWEKCHWKVPVVCTIM